MRILVDIIHPANVHYFKNFIREIKNNNYEIIITSRDKDVSLKLLDSYNLQYINLGKGSFGKGALGKLFYLLYASFIFLKILIQKNPNLCISFGSTPLAITSWFYKIPHISFDDTEHAKLNRFLYAPFTDFIISPNCFYEKISTTKHFKFKGYMELFYLHKNWFQPNIKIFDNLNISNKVNYTVFRFVSWNAFHDIGERGLSLEDKVKLVKYAEKFGPVFISSEGKIDKRLKKYEIKLEPNQLHDLLAFSTLYVGEGGTTASECAMLGVPSIYVNSLPLMGYLKDAEKHGLLYHISDLRSLYSKINEIHKKEKNFYKSKLKDLLANKIDPTSMLIWIVKNYPKSKDILINDNQYQNKFK